MEKKFNVIGGMPRAGSTLLCNILNQNPDIHASDTSPLSVGVSNVSSVLSKRPDYTSELAADKEEARSRLASSVRGLVEGWYEHRDERVVFDKDRSNSWAYQFDSFRYMFPSGLMVLMVRDPREVFASAVRHQDEDPLVRDSVVLQDRTIEARAEMLLGPKGLVGSSILSIANIIQMNQRSNPSSTDHVLLLKYEQLVSRPGFVLNAIYEKLEEESFDHDFDDVKDVSNDLDALYKYQWPHEGSGRVEPREPTWHEVVPPGLAQQILNKYAGFCQFFSYT